MARGVNKVFLVGNLGKDPEVRYAQSGTAFASFSVACNESRKQPDGTYADHVEWVNCVAIGKQAETAGQYLKKGSTVHIEGKLQTRKWQDKDGNTRYSTEVVVAPFGLTMLGKAEGNRPPHPADTEATREQPAGGGGGWPDTGGFSPDDDVPFRELPRHLWRW